MNKVIYFRVCNYKNPGVQEKHVIIYHYFPKCSRKFTANSKFSVMVSFSRTNYITTVTVFVLRKFCFDCFIPYEPNFRLTHFREFCDKSEKGSTSDSQCW